MRKWFLRGAGVLAIFLIAGVIALRTFFVFGPDGPPAEDTQAYVSTSAQSYIQTEIGIPIQRLEKILEAQLGKLNPFFEGQLDRVGIDIVMGIMGMPRRQETKCTTKEVTENVVDAAIRHENCIANAKKLPVLKQLAAEAKCLGQSALEVGDIATTTVKNCVESNVPLPSSPLDIDYAFSIASVQLAVKNGGLEVVADIESTLTVPKSVLSFLDGKKTQKCGPSVSGTAILRPTLTANNQGRNEEGIGQLKIGLDAESVTISPGRPCSRKSSEVQKALDKAMEGALKGLSVAFQKILVDTLEGFADNEDIHKLVDGALRKLIDPMSSTINLGTLIEQNQPGVLPPGVTPYLALQPSKIVLSPTRFVPSKSGGDMVLSPGVVAKPLISFEPIAQSKHEFISIDTDTSANDRFEITVVGQIDLAQAEILATQQVQKIIRAELPGISFESLDVSLYQSRERMVIGVALSGVTWLGLNVQVFLTARPEIDPSGRTLHLKDVKFDVASQNFLLRAASHVLESPVEDTLGQLLMFSLGPGFEAVLAELADTSITLEAKNLEQVQAEDLGLDDAAITLNLRLKSLKLEKLWVSSGRLNAAVAASGRSNISLR